MSSTDIHWVDAVLFVGVGLGVLLGALGGLVRQLMRLGIFAAAVYGAAEYHGFTRTRLTELVGADVPLIVAVAVTFLAILVGLVIAVALVRRVFAAILPAWVRVPLAGLRWVDAGLGAAVAGLVVYLVIGAALLGLEMSPWGWAHNLTAGSRWGGTCMRTTAEIVDAIPQRDKDELAEVLERTKRVGINQAGEAGGSGARQFSGRLREILDNSGKP